MSNKIIQKVLKEIYDNRMKNYKDGEIESVKKAIPRTIELMEKELQANKEISFAFGQTEGIIQAKADFKKMIEDMPCICEVHLNKKTSKRTNAVNCGEKELKAWEILTKLGDDEVVK